MKAEEITKIAVITGAAQGIGRRTAEVFAAAGYGLGLADLRHPEEALKVATEAGGEAIALLGDISDEKVVEGFARTVLEKWGRVDVLVNNAGISFIQDAEKISAADFRRVLEVNLVAPFLLAK